MRSCGGAVQGIREPLLLGGDSEEGSLYLNRANDGFVFYDDGLYSFGPVQCTEQDLFLSNFMFGTSRLVLSCILEEEGASNIQSVFLRKTFGEVHLPSPSIECGKIDPTSLSIEFDKVTKCYMPSASQPWMLPRAKWERQTNAQENESLGDHPIQCFVTAQSASDFTAWTGYGSTEGRVVCGGAVSGGVVQALARQYNPNNALTSVTYLEGRVLG